MQRKWNLLMWMGVSTLHASNINEKTFQFACALRRAFCVDWAIKPPIFSWHQGEKWCLGFALIPKLIISNNRHFLLSSFTFFCEKIRNIWERKKLVSCLPDWTDTSCMVQRVECVTWKFPVLGWIALVKTHHAHIQQWRLTDTRVGPGDTLHSNARVPTQRQCWWRSLNSPHHAA